jgi:hypothetical protein
VKRWAGHRTLVRHEPTCLLSKSRSCIACMPTVRASWCGPMLCADGGQQYQHTEPAPTAASPCPFSRAHSYRCASVAAPAGDMSGKQYIGPGFEHVGVLYDERMAVLEDLRAYLLTGRHPREEMRVARQQLNRIESVMSRRASVMSVATDF